MTNEDIINQLQEELDSTLYRKNNQIRELEYEIFDLERSNSNRGW